ncbi:putative Complex I NDUFA9 subunit family protein [Candidatus Xenohaliotis californiensis]|uniref:Complex I NDUFA9 subunit family protein n=1 Tax=Candidatus Xenohaliotis californiensis TaxID=84677 RepID=A0ABM9N7B5_9RICK|nr:putative Complex I NDUFA9 subunit family protein [Candidatus Xenohaliotis californiensis]
MRCAVFGASSFLARYVIERLLAKKNNTVIAFSRNADSAKHLKVLGYPGQIRIVEYNNKLPHTFIDNFDVVINFIGAINVLSPKKDFFKLHSQIPELIAQECMAHKVKNFIHFSAMGINNSPTLYARSKISGERAVIAAFPSATIIRPSLMYGTDSMLFNFLYTIAQAYVYPMIKLKTIFQPIFVDDVAKFVLSALDNNMVGMYEVAGPRVYSIGELMEVFSKRNPMHMHVCIPISYNIAQFIFYIMNLPLMRVFFAKSYLSIDWLKFVQNNALVTKNNALLSLGIKPVWLESVLIKYFANNNDV